MNIYQKKELYLKADADSRDISVISQLNDEELLDLTSFLNTYPTFLRYNQLVSFSPYDYQRQFFDAAKHYKQRFLCAANRIGKSYGEAQEFAYHITGLYPEDWCGVRIENTGLYWAIGINQDTTRKVVQYELMGTMDGRRVDEIGSRAIPRDCIDFETITRDGARILSCRVKHISGEWNELHFYACSQGQEALMGQAVQYIWMDEEAVNANEIYQQGITRTATTDGFITVTATPESGETDFYSKFANDTTGLLYFQNATWDDCSHLSEEAKKNILAGCDEWARDMRSRGIPVNGTGAIFPFSNEQISEVIDWKDIKPHWLLLAGVDFGYTGLHDPSTIVYLAHDSENNITYTIDAWTSDSERLDNQFAHMPDHMAEVIKSCPYPNIPVICPSDGDGLIQGTNKTRAQVLRDAGCNVLYETFYIPFQLTNSDKKDKSKIGSLAYMTGWMKDGLLKISPSSQSKGLNELWKELRKYVWVQKGGKTVPRDKDDHLMDAWRYAAVNVKYKGQVATTCIPNYVDYSFQEHWSDYDSRFAEAFPASF